MPEALSCDLARLTAADPKDLRLNGKVTTCSIAAAFYQDLIDCDKPTRTAPLSAYLQAEGTKRVPAFVFERLFIQRMRSNHEVSDNWYVCNTRDANAPPIWFKLMSSARDWSSLDTGMTRLLTERGIPVWTAWFECNELWLAEFGRQTEVLSARQFLERNPCGMPTERGRVRSMLTDGHAHPNALRMLTLAGEAANDELVRSRIFINSFLELTGGRPFDVDAICRQGDLIFIAEFKRKYPSRDGFFGVDGHLIRLARMLEDICPFYHFVLEDLRGRPAKGGDPTEALEGAFAEGPNFRWHTLRLTRELERTYTGHLETRGSDSGQRGGVREQVAFPVSAFTRLSGLEALATPRV